MDDELIVLLSPDGQAIGTAPKATTHTTDTPLHLAFSCYLVRPDGQVLITRRAWTKRTFPGVLTNSCCGHPAPGEGLRDAVHRRVRTELGLDIESPRLVLPDFGYRAQAADGLVEYELCPVVCAATTGEPEADPAEVDSAEWYTWDACRELLEHPWSSPWFREQMARLTPLGEPLGWPEADPALLPPALSW